MPRRQAEKLPVHEPGRDVDQRHAEPGQHADRCGQRRQPDLIGTHQRAQGLRGVRRPVSRIARRLPRPLTWSGYP